MEGSETRFETPLFTLSGRKTEVRCRRDKIMRRFQPAQPLAQLHSTPCGALQPHSQGVLKSLLQEQILGYLGNERDICSGIQG